MVIFVCTLIRYYEPLSYPLSLFNLIEKGGGGVGRGVGVVGGGGMKGDKVRGWSYLFVL